MRGAYLDVVPDAVDHLDDAGGDVDDDGGDGGGSCASGGRASDVGEVVGGAGVGVSKRGNGRKEVDVPESQALFDGYGVDVDHGGGED